MTLGLDDLHPSLSEMLRTRLWGMRMGHHMRPEDAPARAVLARRWKGLGWKILGAVPIGAMVGAGIAAASGGSGGSLVGAGFMCAYFAAIGTGVGSILMGRFGRNQSVSAEELRALSTGLELERPDQVYLDTVCALLEAGSNVSDQTGRDILTTLNELLGQAQHVCRRLDHLRKAASSESIADLEAERAKLEAKIAGASDPQAKSDLQQSLSICDDRLQNARVLAPLIERMDAQREVIIQTLLSVQSSASRLQVAPTALSTPDVEEVRRVMSDVTTQTQAVEDAVQEVMTVRS